MAMIETISYYGKDHQLYFDYLGVDQEQDVNHISKVRVCNTAAASLP